MALTYDDPLAPLACLVRDAKIVDLTMYRLVRNALLGARCGECGDFPGLLSAGAACACHDCEPCACHDRELCACGICAGDVSACETDNIIALRPNQGDGQENS